MREQPWNLRRATQWHHRWYRDLLEMHSLTLAWLAELQLERPAHFVGPTVDVETQAVLKQLEQLIAVTMGRMADPDSRGGLDAILDDTRPEDLLSRLDHAIRSAQAITLKSLAPELLAQLEAVTFKCGKDSATSRWGHWLGGREDLRALLEATLNNPFWGRDGVLVRRALSSEVRIELLSCPHLSLIPTVQMAADPVCEAQGQWLRGFVYGLNSKAVVHHQIGRDGRRCSQRWFLSGTEESKA